MSQHGNIEELFHSAFENFEADPGISFSAVQAKMSQATTQTVAGGTTVVSTAKIILIASVLSVSAGLTIGYLLWEAPEKKEIQKTEPEKTVQVTAPETEIISEEKTAGVLNEESSIIVEQKDENNRVNKYRITVTEKENKSIGNESVANSFMTPESVKEKLMSATTTEEKPKTETPREKYFEPSVFNNISVKVEKLDQTRPIAAISSSLAGGRIPLEIEFSNQASGEYTYEWNFGDGGFSREENPVYTFTREGNFTVTLTVKDKNGKTESDKIVIEVKSQEESSIKEYINVFTPNNDGDNDYFMLETKNLETFHIRVQDHFSRIVFFESSDPGFKWDGTDKFGKPVPAGIYYYIIIATGKDGKKYPTRPHEITIRR